VVGLLVVKVWWWQRIWISLPECPILVFVVGGLVVGGSGGGLGIGVLEVMWWWLMPMRMVYFDT
jgi:hypothetical protein